MIPQEIINLVNMALRDGVLTFRERETIIAEASKYGVPRLEAESFLDVSLKSAISKMDKESLRHCPKCGGQIPLIADNCPYCGHDFKEGNDSEALTADSQAARIINQENISTQQSAKNLQKCPDCGAPFPVLGNVCTHCGHVLHEGQYSVFNIGNLIAAMRESIDRMSNCKVKVLDMIWHRSYIYAAELSFLTFIMSSYIENMSFLLPFGLLVYAVISYYRSSKKSDSPVELSDREYYIQLAQGEKYNRHIDALYGIHPEARAVLEQFNAAMADVEKSRRKNRGVVAFINAFVVVLLFSLILFAGRNLETFEGNIKEHQAVYSIMDRKVPVVFGIMGKNGKLSQDALREKVKYFDISDSAVLTVSHRRTGEDYVYDWDSIFVLRLNNVHIKSSGVRYTSLTDTLCLNAAFFDRNGKFIEPPSMLFNEELRNKDHIFHKLPNGKQLDFRTIMAEGKYDYYANFQSGEIGISQIDSLNSFLDRAYSFALFIK